MDTPQKQRFSAWYAAAAVLALVLLQSTLFAPHTQNRLDVMLGGRAAEEIVFGDVSTGAQDDLRRATDLVRQMVTRYGMSKTLGLATVESSHVPLFLASPGMPAAEYSEDTSRLIDQEIRQTLDEAHERVLRDLTAQRTMLEALAAELIEHEVIDRVALDRLMAESPAAAALGATGPTS